MGDLVVEFIQRHCRVTKGRRRGESIKLLPWQVELLDELFVLDPQTLRRRYLRCLIGVARKNGKGLDIETPILTGEGWKQFGELKTGDQVHSVDGKLTPIVAVTTVHHLDCYRVTFLDGQSIVCDSGHQWRVFDRYGHDPDVWKATKSSNGTWKTVATPELARSFRCGARSDTRYSVRTDRILDRPTRQLPIPPYVLGVWLGDGHSGAASVTCGYGDSQIVDEIRREGVACIERRSTNEGSGLYTLGGDRRQAARDVSTQARLRALNLLNRKHIPDTYLTASAAQRLALLQGLMDTDGAVNRGPNTPRVEFTSTNHSLADGVLFLARSLGWKATIHESRAMLTGRDCGPRWRVTWTAYRDRAPFRLARKTAALAESPALPTRAITNTIVNVESVPSVPSRCIQVAHPSGEFLAGRGLIPTHNSTIGAGIALYLLCADGEQGAEVYSVAGDRDQARIVFGEARTMVELEPALSGRLKLYRDAIEDPDTGSIYRVRSAEAYTAEGLNPSGVIFDELHVQPNRELWDVMTQGSGTRDQPLIVALTTAGYDKDSICYQLYDHGKKVQAGEAHDPRFLFRWWEPSNQKCDYRDPEVWPESNPSLGYHLRIEDLQDAINSIPENVFRRYRGNQWVEWNTTWLPPDAWSKCFAPTLDLDPSFPLNVAVDMAQYHDSAAVVGAQLQGDRLVVRARLWENPFPPGTDEFLAYQVPAADLRNYIRELVERFPQAAAIDEKGRAIPGPEIAYDPWGMAESADILEQEKINMLKFPQTEARMVPASSDLFTAIQDGRVAHNGDERFAQHINAAVAKPTDRGWRLARPRGKRVAMDGAVACAIAVHRALQPKPKPKRSAYEDRGLTSA